MKKTRSVWRSLSDDVPTYTADRHVEFSTFAIKRAARKKIADGINARSREERASPRRDSAEDRFQRGDIAAPLTIHILPSQRDGSTVADA